MNLKSLLPIALVVSQAAMATETFKHVFPETMTVDTTTLTLNGKGIRKATVLGVKVYEGGLYLKEKSTSAEAILASADPKVLEIMYLRDLSKRDSEKAWRVAFETNCETTCAEVKTSYESFEKLIVDVKAGDVLRYTFTPKGVDVWLKDGKLGSVEGEAFAKDILASWIGTAPPNFAFKKALLGQ